MKSWHLHIVCLLALFICMSSSKNTASAQQKDLEVFKEVLLSKEGRLDLHTTNKDILESLQEVENSFAKKQSLLNQFQMYSAVLSKIQCGHTQMHPNKEVFREWLAARNSLPFDMYLSGKRLVVNQIIPADRALVNEGKSNYERRKEVKGGSEILQVDHKTVHDIMMEIAPYLSSDEDGMDFKYYQASQLFDFFRHMASPFDEDSIHVQYVYQKDTLEVYLQTGTAPVRTMNMRLRNSAMAFKAEESNFGSFKIIQRHGYFRFSSFKTSYGKKYNEFLEQSFRKLKTRKIDKLIFDLRGNTGGAMQYAIMPYIVGKDVNLGRYVIEKPKKSIESSHLKKMSADYFKHRRASRAQKRLKRKGKFNDGRILTGEVDPNLIYDGDIVVITDEGTFSSAAILACHLKTIANATIIGQPAGGSFYAGNAGTIVLQLPKSKLKMFINPNTFYSHLEKPADPFAIKQPSVVLNPFIINEKRRDAYYLKQAKNAFK